MTEGRVWPMLRRCPGSRTLLPLFWRRGLPQRDVALRLDRRFSGRPGMIVTSPFVSRSEEATMEYATMLARHIPPATTVALYGTLGAGKTRFVQGFAAGFGVDPSHVVSPTFVIHQIYQGAADRDKPAVLHHFDLYRLPDADPFFDLGGDEVLASPDHVLIEWPERIAGYLPESRVEVELDVVDLTTRHIVLRAVGARHRSVAAAIETWQGSYTPSLERGDRS